MDQAAGPAGSNDALVTDGSAPDNITIELLHAPSEVSQVGEVFQQIWGARNPIVSNELLRAIAHADGYVAGAFEHNAAGNRMVGASVGFLGRYDGKFALHSHITGLLAGARSSGIGRQIKQHQREWCLAQGIEWITWTFDPLMRRNAWFNIEILGARMADYLVDFYGPMEDAVNLGDRSDRLLAAWALNDDEPALAVEDGWGEIRVPTPENIVELRRTSPRESEEWRATLRADLGDRMMAGAVVTGFDRDGQYIVRTPS